jgi:hypothetical protein
LIVLQTCPEEKCYGAMAVYRITFSLAVIISFFQNMKK